MIRVAIVDDHALVRAGLRQFLSEHVDLRVVAECASAREAMDVVRQEAADVILLDISMPGQTGVDALQAITARAPDLAVLILSSFPEEHYATAMMRHGRGWRPARANRCTSLPMNSCRNASSRSSCGWPGAKPSATWRKACRSASRPSPPTAAA